MLLPQVNAGPRMLATRLVALVPTVLLAVLFEATNTFDKVAQTLNIVQSLMLPFALIPVIHVVADKTVMGGQFVSHVGVTALAGTVSTAVAAINGYLLVDYLHTQLPQGQGVYVGFSAFIAAYYLLVIYFALGPERWPVLVGRAKQGVTKVVGWISCCCSAGRRRPDFESMLEVHF